MATRLVFNIADSRTMADQLVEFTRAGFCVESFLDAVSKSIKFIGSIPAEDLMDSTDQVESFTDLVSFVFGESSPVTYAWTENFKYENVRCLDSKHTKKNAKYTDIYLNMEGFPAIIDFYKISLRRSGAGNFSAFNFETLRKYSSGLISSMAEICDKEVPGSCKNFKPYINGSSRIQFWEFSFTDRVSGENISMLDVYKKYISGGSIEFDAGISMVKQPEVDRVVYGFGINTSVKIVKMNIDGQEPRANIALVVSDVIIVPDNIVCKFGFAKLVLQSFK